MTNSPRHRREPEPSPRITDFTAPIPVQSRDFDAVAPMRTAPIATIPPAAAGPAAEQDPATTTSDQLHLAHS